MQFGLNVLILSIHFSIFIYWMDFFRSFPIACAKIICCLRSIYVLTLRLLEQIYAPASALLLKLLLCVREKSALRFFQALGLFCTIKIKNSMPDVVLRHEIAPPPLWVCLLRTLRILYRIYLLKPNYCTPALHGFFITPAFCFIGKTTSLWNRSPAVSETYNIRGKTLIETNINLKEMFCCL